MTNVSMIIGRLTRDPELKYLQGSNTAVTRFIVAVDRDYTKKDGSKVTDFIPVETMGNTAEFCATYATKGRLVSVVGAMHFDKYVDDAGETRTFAKLFANKVQLLDKKKEVTGEVVPGGTEDSTYTAIPEEEIPF